MLSLWHHMFNFVLTCVDISSAIMLAIDYSVADSKWSALTWAFIAGPFFTFLIIALTYFYFNIKNQKSESEQYANKKMIFEHPWHAWIYWKATELCLESGPQLILQLYIIALSEQNTTSSAGKVAPQKYKKKFQKHTISRLTSNFFETL